MSTSDEATNNIDADNPPQASAPRSLAVNTPEAPQYPEIDPGEKKEAERWSRDVKVAIMFDEEIRKLFARDRKYGRAESSAKVQHSLIQAYIDILVAFLAARNPDFDALPADSVGDAGMEDAEDYGETMEIVISHLLKSANLKRVAGRQVRSALTVGIGWIKATWQEHYQTDAHAQDELRDTQKNLARAEALRRTIVSGDVADMEAEIARLRALEESISARLEVAVARGMALSLIRPEDMIISIECDSVLDADDADFMGHTYYVDVTNAEAEFPRIPPALLKKAAVYSPRKPGKWEGRQVSGMISDSKEEDASSFVKGTQGEGTVRFLACREIWDSNTSTFFTLIEGITDRYAREPMSPPAPTERFQPFFGLSFTEVDGERYPQSLTQRTAPLQDEIDRTLNALIEHRRRIKPFLVFDARQISPATAKTLTQNVTAERVGVKTIGGKEIDLRRLLVPVQYNTIDMAIYDISLYIRCMETAWGIQEALTSTVQVAKTATEADIQQAGTQAKTGHKRQILEDMLSQLGQYTAQIASNRLSLEDVQQIAGPAALWIQASTPDEMKMLINVEVRAGSSGKPDTAARREAWATQLAQIKELMMGIAQFRNSDPYSVADCMEELLLETGDVLGERIDMKRFIPQVPAVPMMDPMTGRPMTSDQAGAAQAAQRDTEAAAAGNNPGAAPAPPPTDGQDVLAPTAVPTAITDAG